MKPRSLSLCLIALMGTPVQSADAPPAPVYLLASQADMLHLLAPPPDAASQTQREDLQAVLDAQRAAHTNGSLEHAIGDAELSCARMADALQDTGALSREPQVLGLLNEAARESSALSGPVKIYWKRTRPFAFDSKVERHADMAEGTQNSTPSQAALRRIDTGGGATPGAGVSVGTVDLAHSSYPSGHSTFGTVCTILLAQMVPEKRAALFDRGLDYAHSRMVVGAHFPSDLEAGRLTGTVAAELLMQNPRFERDFAAARAMLRADLKLPPEPLESGSGSAP